MGPSLCKKQIIFPGIFCISRNGGLPQIHLKLIIARQGLRESTRCRMVYMGRLSARKTGHMKLIPTGIRPDEPIQCFLSITGRRFQDQPGLCQRSQIAIHRTQTDRRRF